MGGKQKRKTTTRKLPNRLNQWFVTVKQWKDYPQNLGTRKSLNYFESYFFHLAEYPLVLAAAVHILWTCPSTLSVCGYKIGSVQTMCAYRSIQTVCIHPCVHTHAEPYRETADLGDSLGSPWRTGCYCTYFVSPLLLIRHTHMHTPRTGSLQLCIYFLLLSWQKTSFIRGVKSLTRMGNGNNKRKQQYKVMSKNLYKKNGWH